MNNLVYEDLIEAQASLTREISQRTIILPNELHKAYYFSRRYDNIHRLITHCTHVPKRFKSFGVTYIPTKETRL